MPIGCYQHPLFGFVRFQTETGPHWKRGDKISFLEGFNANVIETLEIPQLKLIEPKKKGRIQLHPQARTQLAAALADIAKSNDFLLLTKYDGANVRLKDPIGGPPSKEPSNHAFGIAIDLNDNDGHNGLSVAKVASVFEKYGFCWGITFQDPMHFEIQEFLSEIKIDAIRAGTDKWVPKYEFDYRLLHPTLLASSRPLFTALHDKLAAFDLALGPVHGHREPASAGLTSPGVLLPQNHLPSMAVEVMLSDKNGYVWNHQEYIGIGTVVVDAGLDWFPPVASSKQYARVELRSVAGETNLARDSVKVWQKMFRHLDPDAPEPNGLVDLQWKAFLKKRYNQADITPAIYIKLFQDYTYSLLSA